MKVLLVSGSGFLGSNLARHFEQQNIPFQATARSGAFSLDLEQPLAAQAERIFAEEKFTHLILCAAIADPEDCYRNPERSRRVNLDAPEELWLLARKWNLRPAFFSTDLVFDSARDLRTEEEATCPTTLYGRQKAEAEVRLRETFPETLVFRTSKLMATSVHPRNILVPVVQAIQKGVAYRSFHDQWITPVFAEDVARVVLGAFEQNLSGIYHLAGPERLSRLELAREVYRAWGVEGEIPSMSYRDGPFSEPRGPLNTLSAEKIRRELGFAFTPLRQGIAELKKCWA